MRRALGCFGLQISFRSAISCSNWPSWVIFREPGWRFVGEAECYKYLAQCPHCLPWRTLRPPNVRRLSCILQVPLRYSSNSSGSLLLISLAHFWVSLSRILRASRTFYLSSPCWAVLLSQDPEKIRAHNLLACPETSLFRPLLARASQTGQYYSYQAQLPCLPQPYPWPRRQVKGRSGWSWEGGVQGRGWSAVEGGWRGSWWGYLSFWIVRWQLCSCAFLLERPLVEFSHWLH